MIATVFFTLGVITRQSVAVLLTVSYCLNRLYIVSLALPLLPYRGWRLICLWRLADAVALGCLSRGLLARAILPKNPVAIVSTNIITPIVHISFLGVAYDPKYIPLAI